MAEVLPAKNLHRRGLTAIEINRLLLSQVNKNKQQYQQNMIHVTSTSTISFYCAAWNATQSYDEISVRLSVCQTRAL